MYCGKNMGNFKDEVCNFLRLQLLMSRAAIAIKNIKQVLSFPQMTPLTLLPLQLKLCVPYTYFTRKKGRANIWSRKILT